MLVKDKRWEIFYGDISLEVFASEKMPKATFKKEVSEDVKNAFEVVHKLLTHAYSSLGSCPHEPQRVLVWFVKTRTKA